MAKAKRTTRTSKLKKRWCPIIAPRIFNNRPVGESYVVEPSSLVGRTISTSLADLTGDMRKQNIHVKLKVNSITGEKANTELIGYDMSSANLKRMVRRGSKKITQSLVMETADDKKIRIKLIIVTRGSTKVSVTTALRKQNEEILTKAVKKAKFEELIQEIVNHRLQGTFKRQLGKIYPLKIYEVYHIMVQKEKKHHEKTEK